MDFAGNTSTVKRGLADLGVSSTTSGGGGCRQLWAYTGAVWKALSVCTQDTWTYPSLLPGKLMICRGNSYTIVRTGPSPTAKVLTKVMRNLTVATDQFKLVTGRAGSKDGLGYYRIKIGGRTAWVASYRVTTTDDAGCSFWKVYWTNYVSGHV